MDNYDTSKMDEFEKTAYEKSRLRTIKKASQGMKEEGFSIEKIARVLNVGVDVIEKILNQ